MSNTGGQKGDWFQIFLRWLPNQPDFQGCGVMRVSPGVDVPVFYNSLRPLRNLIFSEVVGKEYVGHNLPELVFFQSETNRL